MKLHKCSQCGYQMIRSEVWISNNTRNAKVFCYSHAPDSAIRLKDTMRASK